MRKFLGLSMIILSLVAFSACSMVPTFEQLSEEEKFFYENSGPTPYTSEEELESITNYGDDFVHWKVARAFAIFEFENEKAKNPKWANGNLSAYPVLLYDGNGKPKVYEFRVVVDGKEIGTVSCTVQKKDGLPVTHFLDFARDYSKILTKGGNAKLIAIGYPSVVAYSENFVKGGRIKVAKSLDNDEEINVPVEVPVIDFLTNATEEELSKLFMTKEEANAVAAQIVAEEESNKIFWEECKQFEQEIINTPVEDLAKSVKKAILRTKGDYDDEYVVSKWWDRRYWYNPGGWCGPNCLTFVSAVDGQYWGANVSGMVPGSEWFMKNIYRKVLEKVGEGAKAPWDLKNALEANTSFSLYWIFSIFGIWSSIRDSLKSVNIPALSLRGSGWVEQANKWDWAWHWRVVLGTRKEHREWQEKWTFLWWSWYVTKTSDTYYYHMRDNGSDGGVFKEIVGGFLASWILSNL